MSEKNSAKVYEFLVLHVPRAKDENEVPDRPTIIVDLERIVAYDEQEASIRAARAIPAEYDDRLDEVQVVIRPF